MEMPHPWLLGVAEALLLRPLQHDPAKADEFRHDVLYAPLPGSKEAKRRATMDVLAAMGVSLEEVQAQARKHAQQAKD